MLNMWSVIGQKTAELCEALKINVDFIPNDYSQEGFLNQFKKDQQSILIPSSQASQTPTYISTKQYSD